MAYENVTPPALPEYNTVTKYLYNGVELPKLPEWDKTVYPYAKIHKFTGGGYCLRISAEPCVLVDGGAAYPYFTYPNGEYLYGFYKPGSDSWTELELLTGSGSNDQLCYWLTWANHDIMNPDGTVYLAASDPVPVESYPYHVLVFDYGAKESDWYQVHLYYSATAFTYNGSVATNAGVVFKQVYDDSIGAWTDYGELSEAVNLSPGLKDGVYQRIYTNHDILDGEGTVWLAADSVTPVEETGVTEEWLHSFKTGLALGLCGKALPWKAEPVAWLYNGVRLPKLPEWDKEKYPYASISSKLGIVSKYRYLWAYADPVLATGNNATSTLAIPRPCLRWKLADDNWVEDALPEDEILTSDSAIIGLWANYNVYYVDDSAAGESLGFEPGSLYLTASEPVPVYE